MDMIEDRNLASHVYDEEEAQNLSKAIIEIYINELNKFEKKMTNKNVMIKGYQPNVRIQEGYQPTKEIPVSAAMNTKPVVITKVIPPKSGTGVVSLKK